MCKWEGELGQEVQERKEKKKREKQKQSFCKWEEEEALKGQWSGAEESSYVMYRSKYHIVNVIITHT